MTNLRAELEKLAKVIRGYAWNSETSGQPVTATKFHEIAQKLENLFAAPATESRSVQRRTALQKGEPMPTTTFGKPCSACGDGDVEMKYHKHDWELEAKAKGEPMPKFDAPATAQPAEPVRKVLKGMQLSDSRRQSAVERQMCGARCLAWADCGDKEFTHACMLRSNHEGEHKFPCKPMVAPSTARPASRYTPAIREHSDGKWGLYLGQHFISSFESEVYAEIRLRLIQFALYDAASSTRAEVLEEAARG